MKACRVTGPNGKIFTESNWFQMTFLNCMLKLTIPYCIENKAGFKSEIFSGESDGGIRGI